MLGVRVEEDSECENGLALGENVKDLSMDIYMLSLIWGRLDSGHIHLAIGP